MPQEELVVLLDEQFAPIGTAPKRTVHDAHTPLHLAFSCYVFDREGRLLLTRRAIGKKTWPGVWTNSFCGHPGPGEDMAEAIGRRARQELGLEVTGLRKVLPDFRYTATDAGGVVENEFCPVWVAQADADPVPEPDEVCEWQWASWGDVVESMSRTPFLFSPWSRLQVPPLADTLSAGATQR